MATDERNFVHRAACAVLDLAITPKFSDICQNK
jgi:hypothetical protein